MAATIEHQEDTTEQKSGPSLVVFLAILVVISLIAGGAGFGVSATMLSPASLGSAGGEMPVKTTITEPAHGEAASGHGEAADPHDMAEAPKKRIVVDLPSITTNLIDPTDVWIRLELSLVFEGESDPVMAEDIHQDILAYVHTMKLYNLRGGSGYQHLMEDLGERAAIRSEGKVKRVLVRSLILE